MQRQSEGDQTIEPELWSKALFQLILFVVVFDLSMKELWYSSTDEISTANCVLVGYTWLWLHFFIFLLTVHVHYLIIVLSDVMVIFWDIVDDAILYDGGSMLQW